MATRHALRLVQRRFSSSEIVAENVFVKGSHLKSPTMAARHALRLVPHRFSSGGKVPSKEEKAAENDFIKKMVLEKLEKLERKQDEFNELAQQVKALKEETASLRAEVLKDGNVSLRAEVSHVRGKFEKLHADYEASKWVETFVRAYVGGTLVGFVAGIVVLYLGN